jgi:hypothetical protein
VGKEDRIRACATCDSRTAPPTSCCSSKGCSTVDALTKVDMTRAMEMVLGRRQGKGGGTEVLERYGLVREACAAELCRVLPDDRLRHGQQRLCKFIRLEGAWGIG